MAYDDNGNYYKSSAELAEEARQATIKKQAGTYVNGAYQPLVMGGGKAAAANATAAVLRGNYDNWKNTYFPVLEGLLNETTYNNPDLVQKETAAATKQVGGAFNAARTGAENTMARYGMKQDPSTAAATDLAEVAATVGAQNQTRMYLGDRDRSIAMGTPRAVSSTT